MNKKVFKNQPKVFDLSKLLKKYSMDKKISHLKIKKKLETVSFEGIRAMVEAGLGIAVLPIGAIKPYLKSSKLKTINIDEKWAKRSIKIAIKNDDSIGKAGALLLNHLIS